MGTAGTHLNLWSMARRGVWRKLPPRCGLRDCIHARSWWRRLRLAPPAVLMQGLRYCADSCLERALANALPPEQPARKHVAGPHRVPLGLLLLSRQHVTPEQLRAALEAQRSAGRGRIGEWLQALGFVNQQQVTAALARQWGCPVFRPDSLPLPAPGRIPQIPLALLRSFLMVPVAYTAATSTLHMAFSERIDYSVLYALEQMLGCRTEPSLAAPSFLAMRLQRLAEEPEETEILFDQVADVAEFARIVHSYSLRVAASEIRLEKCGRQVWVRLFRPAARPLDLLLRWPGETTHSLFATEPAAPSV